MVLKSDTVPISAAEIIPMLSQVWVSSFSLSTILGRRHTVRAPVLGLYYADIRVLTLWSQYCPGFPNPNIGKALKSNTVPISAAETILMLSQIWLTGFSLNTILGIWRNVPAPVLGQYYAGISCLTLWSQYCPGFTNPNIGRMLTSDTVPMSVANIIPMWSQFLMLPGQ